MGLGLSLMVRVGRRLVLALVVLHAIIYCGEDFGRHFVELYCGWYCGTVRSDPAPEWLGWD